MQFQLTKEFIDQLKERVASGDSAWINENVLELHHADIADVLDELSHEEAKHVYYLSSEELQADILMDLQEENRDRLIESLSTKELADQIENLDSDDAADILGELPEDKIQEVISQMQDDAAAEDIIDLLNYDEDIAGGLMQKEFLKVELDWPVNRALRQLRRQAEDVERVYNIFVTDAEEHLLGVLSLKRLLIANSTTKIA
jgi:magnesium transporter